MSSRNVTTTIAGTIIRFAMLAVIVAFIFRLATTAYEFGYRIFAEPPMAEKPGTDISVAITDDMSTMDIAKLLENQGLIKDAKLFFVQEKVSEYKDMIQPGIYELNTSMTAEEMLAVIGAPTEEATDEYTGDSEDSLDETTVNESEAATEGMTEETTPAE